MDMTEDEVTTGTVVVGRGWVWIEGWSAKGVEVGTWISRSAGSRDEFDGAGEGNAVNPFMDKEWP